MFSKEIAAALNISSKTVENHRARIMRKMQAKSVADLVRMAITLQKGEVALAPRPLAAALPLEGNSQTVAA